MFTESIVIGRRAISLEKIQYHILPGKFGSLINRPLFSEMFSFWKKQWEPLVKGLAGLSVFKSDDFLRQFEITAISYEGQIVGVLCLDLFDLNNDIHLDHSYFSWLQSNDLRIFQNFGYSLVINQLTVAKLWRGEFGIADLLVGLAVKRMKQSNFDRTICYTRNFRRTNTLAERWGAHAILDDQLVHNEPSTYYEFPKDCFSIVDHPLKGVVDYLWLKGTQNKTIILNEIKLDKTKNEGNKYETEINQ